MKKNMKGKGKVEVAEEGEVHTHSLGPPLAQTLYEEDCSVFRKSPAGKRLVEEQQQTDLEVVQCFQSGCCSMAFEQPLQWELLLLLQWCA